MQQYNNTSVAIDDLQFIVGQKNNNGGLSKKAAILKRGNN